MGPRKQGLRTHSPEAATAARVRALADRLEDSASKRALAEALASRATVRGVCMRQSAAQVEADLFAELQRHEKLATLRRNARKGKGKS